MNARQMVILGIGAVLLTLNFLFPWTSYPIKGEEVVSDEGQVSVTYTARTRFMPIWEALAAHERAELKGNIFGDTIIQWPAVIGFACVIVISCGWACYQSRHPAGRSKSAHS